ncbi:MAG: precorrin-3B C(17)-methyltransferase [Firmicutes bacterium]|nr:precorrin-3B C(17)-methyltransferase [Bacillota bacterium]
MENRIYIVGIGPGKIEYMSQVAIDTLRNSDVIVGYKTYIDLVKAHFPQVDFEMTGMRQEKERCELCFDLAKKGKKVSLICSGDAGVYGMVSLMYEIKKERNERIELEVVAGITAANSGAAILGAPLNHDYCLISLSDLLTPWEVIEKRLVAAVQGDFAISLYNPSSRKRKDHLKRACQILLDAGADPMRACGYVKNIGREDTVAKVCTLEELQNEEVDMFTTVFIGNSHSYLDGNHIVTKRGYVL